MEAIDFIIDYKGYLTELERIIQPQHLKIVKKLRKINPCNLVKYNLDYPDDSFAIGFVYTMFIDLVNQKIKDKLDINMKKEESIHTFAKSRELKIVQNNNTLNNQQNMESIEFVVRYHQFLNEISELIKDEFQPIIQELKEVDPHDLVLPETWFPDINYARGSVWKLFIHTVKSKRKMDLE